MVQDKKQYVIETCERVYDQLKPSHQMRYKRLKKYGDDVLFSERYDAMTKGLPEILWSASQKTTVQIHSKEQVVRAADDKSCEVLLWLLEEL